MSGIDTLNFKLKREIEKVDHEIVDAVRHQTSSGNQAREELIQVFTIRQLHVYVVSQFNENEENDYPTVYRA